MKGGGYNRVIGFSVPGKTGAEKASCVLRIPRFEAAQMLSDIASLDSINKSSQLPVPELLPYDSTT
jgi:hypothetical protein